MRPLIEARAAIGALIAFSVWLLVILPIYHGMHGACSAKEIEIFGFWEKARCDPVAAFTLVLAAFTAVLAVSTIGLWIATDRGVRNQRNDTRILQRAYISVEPSGILPMNDGRMNAHYVIRNAGRLPARSVRWFAYLKESTWQGETNFPISESDLYGNNVLAAGAGMTHGTGSTELTGGYVYVWGIVRYDDGFGEQRFTKFCHRYNTRARQPYPGERVHIPSSSGRHHGWGNSTDETES